MMQFCSVSLVNDDVENLFLRDPSGSLRDRRSLEEGRKDGAHNLLFRLITYYHRGRKDGPSKYNVLAS
jgi:hypothetical protein